MAADYYELLQVRPHATAHTIRRAYSRWPHNYHPDANPENQAAGARFREVLLAYETLRDPQRRAAYDYQRQVRADARTGVRPAERNFAAAAGRVNAGPRRVARPPSSAPRRSGPPFYPRVVASRASFSCQAATVGLVLLLILAASVFVALPAPNTKADSRVARNQSAGAVESAVKPLLPQNIARSPHTLEEEPTVLPMVLSHDGPVGMAGARKNPSDSDRIREMDATRSTQSLPAARTSRDANPLADFKLEQPLTVTSFAAGLLGPLSTSAWKPTVDWTVQWSVHAAVVDSPLSATSLVGDATRIPENTVSPLIDFATLTESQIMPWKPMPPMTVGDVMEGLEVRPPRPGSVYDYFTEKP